MAKKAAAPKKAAPAKQAPPAPAKQAPPAPGKEDANKYFTQHGTWPDK